MKFNTLVLSFAAIKWLHSSFTVRGWHRTKEVKLWHKSAKMPRLNTQCKNVRGDVCHANVKEFWMFSSSGKYRGNKLQICFFCDWKTIQSLFIFNLKQHYCYFYEKITGWRFFFKPPRSLSVRLLNLFNFWISSFSIIMPKFCLPDIIFDQKSNCLSMTIKKCP